MTLTIMFIGLISHFQLRGTTMTRAVLLAGPHHEAIMAIKLCDLNYKADEVKKAVEQFAEGKIVHFAGNDWGRWELGDEHLTFSPPPPAGETIIDKKIPNLAYITNGFIPLEQVEKGVIKPYDQLVSAYVDYSGGTLNSNPRYPCEDFKWLPPMPPAGKDCRPKASGNQGTATPWVEYKAAVNEPLVSYEGVSLRLKATATVWIGNLSDGDRGKHHEHYLGLLADGRCISGIPRKTKCPPMSVPAPLGPAEGPADRKYVSRDLGNPECTDSHFP